MTRCPFCFHDLLLQEAAFVCTDPVGECPDVRDERWKAFRGGDAPLARPVTLVAPQPDERRWQRPLSASCEECTATTTAQVCPRCHHPLPPAWRENTTTCIAVAGPRSSGKSVYIAVMVKQAQLLVQGLGGALGFGDSRTEKTYTERYEEPLYEARGMIEPTARSKEQDAPQRVPLVFPLGLLGGKRHVLVVRDLAGEELEDATTDPGPFRFLRDADGILFLVDPLKRESIRLMLKGIIDDKAAGGEPLNVLDNIARFLREPGSTARVAVPLAVVLSKFDALRALREVPGTRWDAVMANAGAAINRDPSMSRTFDLRDADLLQAEVESVLARLGEHAVLNRLDSDFAETRLFAVSALGAPPKGPNQHAHGIAPYRCLDPLKWLLSRSGALASG